jgi:hypothetical protein
MFSNENPAQSTIEHLKLNIHDDLRLTNNLLSFIQTFHKHAPNLKTIELDVNASDSVVSSFNSTF